MKPQPKIALQLYSITSTPIPSDWPGLWPTRLVLGGSGVHGTVSAATHPDFIQGRGVLSVTGKGEPATTVIFR